MKLKTEIRAGKIRPNHNVTVHGTAAWAQTSESTDKTTELVSLAAATNAR